MPAASSSQDSELCHLARPCPQLPHEHPSGTNSKGRDGQRRAVTLPPHMRSELLEQRQHLLGGAETAIGPEGPSRPASWNPASVILLPPQPEQTTLARKACGIVHCATVSQAGQGNGQGECRGTGSSSILAVGAPALHLALSHCTIPALPVLAVQNSWGQKQITAVRTCDPSSSWLKPSELPKQLSFLPARGDLHRIKSDQMHR